MRHVFFSWVLSLGMAAFCACSSAPAKKTVADSPTLTAVDSAIIQKVVEEKQEKPKADRVTVRVWNTNFYPCNGFTPIFIT